MQQHPWTLKFELAQFTPAEAEQMTSATPAMQRDWRHRGFLPRYEKHARFTIFDLVQLYVMKAYANHGRGPSQSAEHAVKVIGPVVLSGLTYESQVWGNAPLKQIFNDIPDITRRAHPNEEFDAELVERGIKTPEWLAEQGDLDPCEISEWFGRELLQAMGLDPDLRAKDAVWWPTNDWEMADYHDMMISNAYDKTDPRFDGAALIINLDQVARILAAKAPRPWVSVAFERADGSISATPLGGTPLGQVIVTGQEARAVPDAA